jgi:hypothetical protein
VERSESFGLSRAGSATPPTTCAWPICPMRYRTCSELRGPTNQVCREAKKDAGNNYHICKPFCRWVKHCLCRQTIMPGASRARIAIAAPGSQSARLRTSSACLSCLTRTPPPPPPAPPGGRGGGTLLRADDRAPDAVRGAVVRITPAAAGAAEVSVSATDARQLALGKKSETTFFFF